MVPFQATFGIRLYLSTGWGATKKPSNWEDCSTNGAMNKNKVKQGAGVCPTSRDRHRPRMVLYSSLPKVCKNTVKTKTQITHSLCIWQMEIKTFVLFWGYGWERIENISAEKAQKHLSNLERNEDVISGLFVFPPAVAAEHKDAAERMHKIALW